MNIKDYIPTISWGRKRGNSSPSTERKGLSGHFGIYGEKTKDIIMEKLRGKIVQRTTSIHKDLGEPHPFNYGEMEGIVLKVGFVHGIIEKYLDAIWGPGVFVKTDMSVPGAAKALKIIEDWLRDVDFPTIGRRWTKEALVKGSGYMELEGDEGKPVKNAKVLNSNHIFIQRSDTGEILNYKQFMGNTSMFKEDEATTFKPFQIAHLSFNMIGDNPYGYGLVFPALDYIDNLLMAQKESHILLKRKANSPYDITVGNDEFVPSQGEIDNIANDFTWLNNKHELVHGTEVAVKTLDFGNIGDKFDVIFSHDEKMLFFSFQTPAMLMGEANISEGQGKIQFQGWSLTMQSKQAEIEKVVEQKMFRRILDAQGLDIHVELQWGQPTNEERNAKLEKVTALLNLFDLTPAMRKALEIEAAKLMDFSDEVIHEIEETEIEEREREETEEQPRVPGQGQREHVHSHKGHSIEENMIEQMTKDVSITEWLDFNYQEFLKEIDTFIINDSFEAIVGKSAVEIAAGRLDAKQIAGLKRILRKGFREEKSIRSMAKEIDDRLGLKDLRRFDKKTKKYTGKIAVAKDRRGNMLARTETTRTAFEGSRRHYKDKGIERMTFIASLGPRTCPICEGLHGQIYNFNETAGIIPVHTYCRCTMIPTIEG